MGFNSGFKGLNTTTRPCMWQWGYNKYYYYYYYYYPCYRLYAGYLQLYTWNKPCF